jgi:hypothetical protein
MAREQQDAETNERLASLEEQQAPAASAGPAGPAPAAPTPSMLDQLDRLATLHQQGTLSDEEFTAAKARLLNG